MRLRNVASVLFVVCAAAPLVAQPALASPKPPTAAVSRPPAHPKPAIPTAPAPPLAVFDATGLGSPLALNRDWRVGITSDPAAAKPEFNDSAWAIRDAKAPLADIPDPDAPSKPETTGNKLITVTNTRRYAWFRLHIQLAPNHGPLALLIELPVSEVATFAIGAPGLSPDVFANGHQILPEGPDGNAPQRYHEISRIYNLNLAPSDTSLTLVVRTIYIPFGYGAYTAFFANRTLSLGNPADLQRELNLWSNRNLFERLPRLVYSVLLVVLAVFLFALYFAQKGHVEYLWLALHELVQAPLAFIDVAGSSARLDSLWYAALDLQLILISAYLFFEFLVSFLSLRRRWYIVWLRYTAPILAGLGPTLLLVGHSSAIGVLLASIFVCCILWMIGWSIFIFGTLISATLKRNFEAGLLLIPLVLNVVGIAEPIITTTISENTGSPIRPPLTLHAGRHSHPLRGHR